MNLGDAPMPNSQGTAWATALLFAPSTGAQALQEQVVEETPVAFEINGISRDLITKFSRRRQYIKAVADKLASLWKWIEEDAKGRG